MDSNYYDDDAAQAERLARHFEEWDGMKFMSAAMAAQLQFPHPRRAVVRLWNARTGWSEYPVDPATGRAVWREWNGPDLRGYFTAWPSGQARETTRADYESYRRSVYGR